jgi:hypothetical protein
MSVDARGFRLPPSSRNIRLMAGALIVLLGCAAVAAHASEYAGTERFSKDFALDYASGKALLDGADPYAPIEQLVGRYLDPPAGVLERNILPGANWHTPFKLVVTLPLTALPYRAAGVVWLLLCAAAIVAAGVVLGRELGWTRGASGVMGFAFLAVPVVQIDLSAGNLNGPMLLLIVLAWRFFRRRSDTAGGLALGGVTALKFFPALLALPLLSQRRARAIATAATVTIVLTAGGLLALGGDHVRSFLEAGRGSEGFDHWDAAPANLSWWGLATRWLVPNGWVDAADLRPLGLALAIGGVLVLLAAMLVPRARLSRDVFIAGLPLMLLAWPISWNHYLTLALPWIVLAGREVARRGGAALLAVYGVVAAALMIGFPPGAPAAEEASTVEVVFLYQLPTYALIAAALMDRFAHEQEA